jgi:GH15 family glucan-1,4-alpha-glucosidase
MVIATKVHAVLKSSAKVFENSQLPNGAIIASNSDPNGLQNYRFVWTRDAAFVIYASKLLGYKSIQSRFLDWLVDYCVDYRETGRIYKNYTINGARAHDQYQPDQVGALLWAIYSDSGDISTRVDRVTTRLADALADSWNGSSFSSPTFELWENRWVSPGSVPYTYTLAAVSTGLEMAAAYHGADSWRHAANQMRRLIQADRGDFYTWRPNEEGSRLVDASLLSLAWPFGRGVDAELLGNTIVRVEDELLTPQGVHRFPEDTYDGHVPDRSPENGPGAWPLLTFWYVIALARNGQRAKAEKIFEAQLKLIPEDDIIPEQYFAEPNRVAIRPLAWSHAMFVIACAELNLL